MRHPQSTLRSYRRQMPRNLRPLPQRQHPLKRLSAMTRQRQRSHNRKTPPRQKPPQNIRMPLQHRQNSQNRHPLRLQVSLQPLKILPAMSSWQQRHPDSRMHRVPVMTDTLAMTSNTRTTAQDMRTMMPAPCRSTRRCSRQRLKPERRQNRQRTSPFSNHNCPVQNRHNRRPPLPPPEAQPPRPQKRQTTASPTPSPVDMNEKIIPASARISTNWSAVSGPESSLIIHCSITFRMAHTLSRRRRASAHG